MSGNKFGILLARQRSGTGALGSILDRHRQLHYLGEILHPGNLGQEKNFFTYLSQVLEEDKEAFLPKNRLHVLDKFVDTMREDGVTPILDVKYSSIHHLYGDWQSPLSRPQILNHAEGRVVPIIHLTRKNHAKTFVSGRLAETNAVWHTNDKSAAQIRSIEINPAQLLRFIRNSVRESKLVQKWLAGHPRVVTFDYSDMLDPQGRLTDTICEKLSTTLGIESFVEKQPSFVKQAPDSLKESIKNYDEVADHLSDTSFRWMLK